MKRVALSGTAFMAFLVLYEMELFTASYALLGLSVLLGMMAVVRGYQKTPASGMMQNEKQGDNTPQ